MQTIVISVSVCLSVCRFVCVMFVRSNVSTITRSNFTEFFVHAYLLPWLDPLLAALRYIMYIRFRGRRHVCTQ